MSFSAEKKSRAALSLAICLCAPLVFSGCASVKQAATKWWPWGKGNDVNSEPMAVADEESRLDDLALPELAPEQAIPTESDILVYWETIRGGYAGADSRLMSAADKITGGDYIQLVRPVALSVRDRYIYIVDDGLGLVLRYDKTTARMERMLELTGVTSGEAADIHVSRDLSFYVTDTFGSRVLHYSEHGKLLRTFQNKLNMVRPIAVSEDQASGNILVADAYFDHLLVFSPPGELIGAVGGRGDEPGQFLNITTMAAGPDGFYVGARVGQHVQVLSPQGEYLYSLDQSGIVFPFAMAVDENFFVFLGDYIDNTIKVYLRGKYLTSIGHSGVGPGEFKRIADLAVDGGFLYAADSLNGRIQVLKVVEPVPIPVATQGLTAP